MMTVSVEVLLVAFRPEVVAEEDQKVLDALCSILNINGRHSKVLASGREMVVPTELRRARDGRYCGR